MTGQDARTAVGTAAVTLLLWAGGCNVDTLLHQTASFGGQTAGQRGSARVLFINNTPYRVIFTFGAYDDFDQDSVPNLILMSPHVTQGLEGEDLEGNATSSIFTVTCARVFSIGGDTMLRLAQENGDPALLVEDALVPGVYFSSAELGDENETLPTEGVAGPVDLWLGADFPCNSLIVFRLEFNDADPAEFRIDYEVFPSESDR